MALGVYLRKFFLSKLESDDVGIDTKSFGKFSLVTDPLADADDLYPKKIVFEPTGAIARGVRQAVTLDQSGPPAIAADFGRLTRLCRLQN